ncbi:MAG: hypothetical protein ACYC26_10500 [Phycisphaerales bacterium]
MPTHITNLPEAEALINKCLVEAKELAHDEWNYDDVWANLTHYGVTNLSRNHGHTWWE